ncbi:hypothetical protein TSUD_220310 [Trifolium subterraneum]|uniref:Uncharacterized protein n=1 Tax=Trifolium subterraneum TaxID=3900 RepID=A0A2Z6PA81_TRISU|nr:hypothetical protein TSUD_220310 [Trifolium subterraneum]
MIVFPDKGDGLIFNSGILDFIGDHKISKIVDLCNVEEGGVAIFLACYYGVESGVYMWFVEDDDRVYPRKAAPETCALLVSMKDGSEAYPRELDQMFGDPVLFKVMKNYHCDACGAIVVEVLDLHFDPSLLELYLDPNNVAYNDNVLLHDESSTGGSSAQVVDVSDDSGGKVHLPRNKRVADVDHILNVGEKPPVKKRC